MTMVNLAKHLECPNLRGQLAPNPSFKPPNPFNKQIGSTNSYWKRPLKTSTRLNHSLRNRQHPSDLCAAKKHPEPGGLVKKCFNSVKKANTQQCPVVTLANDLLSPARLV